MNIRTVTAILCLTFLAGVALAEESELLAIVKANFEAADVDGSGSLDADEFPSLIDANAEHNLGRAATVKRLGVYDRAFKTADRDGDGVVSWSDLMASQSN